MTRAKIHYWPEAHDGPGWYYTDEEYPEEGSTGAFATFDEAAKHALQDHAGVEIMPGAVDAYGKAQRQAGRDGGREADTYGRCVPPCGCRDCGRPRALGQTLIAVIGAPGPESAEETVARAAAALRTTKPS